MIQEGDNGRDRDRTDDLYRVKVIETVYLVGSSRFLLLLSDVGLRYSTENWSRIGRILKNGCEMDQAEAQASLVLWNGCSSVNAYDGLRFIRAEVYWHCEPSYRPSPYRFGRERRTNNSGNSGAGSGGCRAMAYWRAPGRNS